MVQARWNSRGTERAWPPQKGPSSLAAYACRVVNGHGGVVVSIRRRASRLEALMEMHPVKVILHYHNDRLVRQSCESLGQLERNLTHVREGAERELGRLRLPPNRQLS